MWVPIFVEDYIIPDIHSGQRHWVYAVSSDRQDAEDEGDEQEHAQINLKPKGEWLDHCWEATTEILSLLAKHSSLLLQALAQARARPRPSPGSWLWPGLGSSQAMSPSENWHDSAWFCLIKFYSQCENLIYSNLSWFHLIPYIYIIM